MMGAFSNEVTPGPVKSAKKRGMSLFDFHFQILVNMKREAMLIRNEEMKKLLLDAIATAGADLFFWNMSWQEKQALDVWETNQMTPALRKELKAKAKERIIRESE